VKQLVLPPGARSDDRVELRDREHHYLARVRRIAVGERLAALDEGRRLVLEVAAVEADRTVLRVVEQLSVAEAPATRLVLFPFLLKARKLDDVIRQACEAGVSAIVPVVGDHCVARTDGEEDGAKKAVRWNAIAKEAAQQSGNARVCQVRPPVLSRRLAEAWTETGPLLFFHQAPLDKASLHRYLFPRPDTVGLIVGPEGGLSSAEVDAFRSAGARPVWLGPFVLRAETASVYAVAAVNTILQETPEWTIPL
jgi:16S rRNA (uracil1498-N3)-methyltransferase